MTVLFQIRNRYFPYFIFQMYFRITLRKQNKNILSGCWCCIALNPQIDLRRLENFMTLCFPIQEYNILPHLS